MRSFIVMITMLMTACVVWVAVAQTTPVEGNRVQKKPEILGDEELRPEKVTPRAGPVDPQVMLRQQKEIRERLVATLASLVPAEYDAYQKALLSNNEADTARAAIQMVLRIGEVAGKPAPRKQVIYAYRTAWELCLQLFKNCKSAEARQLILDQWNRSLCREGTILVQQLTALYLEFDRRLLTAAFWKLFEESKKRESMSAICYVLYKHGDREDANRLQKRYFTMASDDERRSMVWNAFNCLQWRLAGSDPNMGPVPVFQ